MATDATTMRAILFHPRVVAMSAWVLPLILVIGVVSGCALFDHERSVYDREGVRIGLEPDPSVRQSSERDLNNHPLDVSPKDLESLLQTVQISGYSGTIAALLIKPQPVPLFTPKELMTVTGHLAMAFREATPTERVFFSLPKPDVTYSEDRTVGSLFFRGPYLHLVVTDHSSIIRTDSGGGDYRDIRDTKGLRLSASGPTQTTTVPDPEEPRWAHFERVHISLSVKDVLARKASSPAGRPNQAGTGSSVPPPSMMSPDHPQPLTSPEELQRQIRDLSGTNQELRDRLDAQHKRMQQLQEQVDQLRREVPSSDPNGQLRKTTPAP